MVEQLKKIVDLALKNGFFKTLDGSGFIEFGPLGMLLANNIYNEWYHSNVINSDLNMFLYNSNANSHWHKDCQNSYVHSLQTTAEQLPFGLASTLTCFPDVKKEVDPDSVKTQSAYRCLVFLHPKDSQQYFYRWQHQRKIWWRKFSTAPERFNIIEDKGDEKQETVKISATFPWKTEILETIHNHGSNPLISYGSLFEAKVGRKKILPHVIESICLEQPAVMTYLCDAFQLIPYRPLLRLHRSLSPYNVSLAVDPTGAGEKVEELNQLATYLNLSLRRGGMHTLFSMGSRAKKSLESQFTGYDCIGVPYTVVVTSDALLNGIVGLRSRDTTLQEQVHVSKLIPYMQQLLKKP